jgi:hypothetical protein
MEAPTRWSRYEIEWQEAGSSGFPPMWSFFCESHQQKLLKTIARLDHSHIMRAPVNGYEKIRVFMSK